MRIDIPKKCPKCGGDIQRIPGKFGEFYGCSSWPQCDIIWNEYGFSDWSIRNARKRAHKVFDHVWKRYNRDDAWVRKQMYQELAKYLGIPFEYRRAHKPSSKPTKQYKYRKRIATRIAKNKRGKDHYECKR
jgi:ssDNA-binding Zn-finger/Zn-ribbon topoisomerase 1